MEAQKIASHFYDCIKKKDFKGTFTFISNKFWQSADSTKFIEFLTDVNNNAGNLQEYLLDKWETRFITGTSSCGQYALQYKNTYERKSFIETINLELESDNKIRIIGYHIESNEFIK